MSAEGQEKTGRNFVPVKDRPEVEIPGDNPLMNVFFDLGDRLQIPGQRHLMGRFRWGGFGKLHPAVPGDDDAAAPPLDAGLHNPDLAARRVDAQSVAVGLAATPQKTTTISQNRTLGSDPCARTGSASSTAILAII